MHGNFGGKRDVVERNRPADDAIYNKTKELLQTKATLCRFLY